MTLPNRIAVVKKLAAQLPSQGIELSENYPISGELILRLVHAVHGDLALAANHAGTYGYLFSSANKPAPVQQSIHPKGELTYSDRDPEDDDLTPKTRRPKWQIPSTAFEEEILAACRRKYFPTKDLGYQVSEIEKDSKVALQTGTLSRLPYEWVQFCIGFAKKKNRLAPMMDLEHLVKYIRNQEKMTNWLRGYIKKHQIAITANALEGEFDPYEVVEDSDDYLAYYGLEEAE